MNLQPRSSGTNAHAELGPVEAQDLLRRGAVMVDVREPDEWDAGHAPDAVHHRLGQLVDSMERLPRDRTLVVVCRSGNRSARATELLNSAGFDAVNLAGGMIAWSAEGFAVVEPGDAR